MIREYKSCTIFVLRCDTCQRPFEHCRNAWEWTDHEAMVAEARIDWWKVSEDDGGATCLRCIVKNSTVPI